MSLLLGDGAHCENPGQVAGKTSSSQWGAVLAAGFEGFIRTTRMRKIIGVLQSRYIEEPDGSSPA
jgi:hypothetical protein